MHFKYLNSWPVYWLTSHGWDLIRCCSVWTLSSYLTCNAAWANTSCFFILCVLDLIVWVNTGEYLETGQMIRRHERAVHWTHLLQIICKSNVWLRRQMRLTFFCSCSTRSAPLVDSPEATLDSDSGQTWFFRLAASIKKGALCSLRRCFNQRQRSLWTFFFLHKQTDCLCFLVWINCINKYCCTLFMSGGPCHLF